MPPQQTTHQWTYSQVHFIKQLGNCHPADIARVFNERYGAHIGTPITEDDVCDVQMDPDRCCGMYTAIQDINRMAENAALMGSGYKGHADKNAELPMDATPKCDTGASGNERHDLSEAGDMGATTTANGVTARNKDSVATEGAKISSPTEANNTEDGHMSSHGHDAALGEAWNLVPDDPACDPL